MAEAAVPERAMRARKLPKPCPACKADIADFLRTARENKEMAAVIARLQQTVAAQKDSGACSGALHAW